MLLRDLRIRGALPLGGLISTGVSTVTAGTDLVIGPSGPSSADVVSPALGFGEKGLGLAGLKLAGKTAGRASGVLTIASYVDSIHTAFTLEQTSYETHLESQIAANQRRLEFLDDTIDQFQELLNEVDQLLEGAQEDQ